MLTPTKGSYSRTSRPVTTSPSVTATKSITAERIRNTEICLHLSWLFLVPAWFKLCRLRAKAAPGKPNKWTSGPPTFRGGTWRSFGNHRLGKTPPHRVPLLHGLRLQKYLHASLVSSRQACSSTRVSHGRKLSNHSWEIKALNSNRILANAFLRSSNDGWRYLLSPWHLNPRDSQVYSGKQSYVRDRSIYPRKCHSVQLAPVRSLRDVNWRKTRFQ